MMEAICLMTVFMGVRFVCVYLILFWGCLSAQYHRGGVWSKRRQTKTATVKTATNQNGDKLYGQNGDTVSAKTATNQNGEKVYGQNGDNYRLICDVLSLFKCLFEIVYGVSVVVPAASSTRSKPLCNHCEQPTTKIHDCSKCRHYIWASFDAYNCRRGCCCHSEIAGQELRSWRLADAAAEVCRRLDRPVLCELFNRLLTMATVPDVFKFAYITLPLKKQVMDSVDVRSYRPISNLSVLSKLLERLDHRQMLDYLNRHRLL